MQKVALRATNGKQHYQEVPFQEQEPSFFNDLLEKITLFCYCGKKLSRYSAIFRLPRLKSGAANGQNPVSFLFAVCIAVCIIMLLRTKGLLPLTDDAEYLKSSLIGLLSHVPPGSKHTFPEQAPGASAFSPYIIKLGGCGDVFRNRVPGCLSKNHRDKKRVFQKCSGRV